jgi:hypothetical protein
MTNTNLGGAQHDELPRAWKALSTRARCILLNLVCLFAAVCVVGTVVCVKAATPACAVCPDIVVCPVVAHTNVSTPIVGDNVPRLIFDEFISPITLLVWSCMSNQTVFNLVIFFIFFMSLLLACRAAEQLWLELVACVDGKLRKYAADAARGAATDAAKDTAIAAATDAVVTNAAPYPVMSASSSSSSSARATHYTPLRQWFRSVHDAVMSAFKLEGIPAHHWFYFVQWLCVAKGSVYKPTANTREAYSSLRYLAPALAMQMLLDSESDCSKCQQVVILTPPGKAETQVRIALANLFVSPLVHVVSSGYSDLLYRAGTWVIVVDVDHVANYTEIKSRLPADKMVRLGWCVCDEAINQPTPTPVH